MNNQLEFYFNTNGLSDHDLKARKERIGGQNRKVLDYFRNRPEGYYTPFDVQSNLFWNEVPITSVRRALTTLTELGYLVKTDVRRPGKYGDDNFCWRLK